MHPGSVPPHLDAQQGGVEDEVPTLVEHGALGGSVFRFLYLSLHRQSAPEVDGLQTVQLVVAALDFLRYLGE